MIDALLDFLWDWFFWFPLFPGRNDRLEALEREARQRERVFAETQIALIEEGHMPEWSTPKLPGSSI